ncbi:hypothetical protein RB2654_15135 [Rhodobacterales bacterium HTCC2654]|uniref:Uncharacterized protein n=1 Tax=Maritimibacter alkaliphilus HTCC2654 TaxID=314271 RepID=A3VH76_9RHOB|nr:hypothetical protein RB2654_15135 [Rhodobacterales bacterium HTCC2654] [Maritimibacter alkaliphilus HTCC2654]
MPEFRKEFDVEHLAQIGHAGCAAGAAFEADHPFDRGDVVEAPAPEIVLEIDQFLGQFVKRPMRAHVAIDGRPPLLNRLDRLMRMVQLRRGDIAVMPVERFEQEPHRLVIKARTFEFAGELRVHLWHMGMWLQQVRIAVAEDVFDQPVLVGLEPGGRAEHLAKGGIIRRGHRAQDVPLVIELLEDARHAGEHLEHRRQIAGDQGFAGRLHLVQDQLHPKLARVVLDDEQQLVMRAGERVLLVEQGVEVEVIAIGHGPGHRHLGAFAAGIVCVAAHLSAFSLKRWIFPLSVFGSASVNRTLRGYL